MSQMLRISVPIVLLLTVACTFGKKRNSDVAEPVRSPSAAGNFEVHPKLFAQDYKILVEQGLVKKADMNEFYLQEIVSDVTQNLTHLSDESFVVAPIKPSPPVGARYYVGVVHFLNGESKIHYVIKSRNEGQDYITLGIGFVFIFDKSLKPAEREKVLAAVNEIEPNFRGFMNFGTLLETAQPFFEPKTIKKIKDLLKQGVPGVSGRLKEFEIKGNLYNLPKFTPQIALKPPVADIRTLMPQYQDYKSRSIAYRSEPRGIQ